MAEKGTGWFGLLLLIAGMLAIYGYWNKPEQMRPTSYEKGLYGGQSDTGLDGSTVEGLRQRMDRYRNSGS